MIIRKSEAVVKQLDKCHDGSGVLQCTEYLGAYQQKETGIKFYHDNILQPKDSIGEHRHTDDEEMYVILEGSGTMKIDGKDQAVQGGDICLTRHGHSHDLKNTGAIPMHFLVIGVNVQEKK
jgi:mannose-6-phosphate isomerase-like protein (cupin superfamily)